MQRLLSAMILFVLLVLDHAQLAHASLVFNTVLVTVGLSVLLHGLSALPGVKAYDMVLKMCDKRGDDVSAEKQLVSEMPLRLAAIADNEKDAL